MSAFLQYLITGLGVGCAFALIGSGLVVIYRVTRVVNFAQGAFAVIAAMTVSSLLGARVPHGLAEALAVALAGLVGLLVGLTAIGKPGTSPQSALIVTLGVAVFAYAVEILIWGDQPRSFPGLPASVTVLGARVQSHYLLIIAASALVFLAMALLFARTDLGKALTASAANPYAARIVGIDVRRMGLLSFVIGGALGGLAGVLVTPVQQVTFDGDVVLVVSGFAAAILGDLTRPAATLLGGLLLGVAQAMVAGYLSTSYQSEVALLLMLVVLIAQAARRPMIQEETA
ncbi:branched-chain amino acid ABC transporter permease [Amorphoplanes digitatis]|uniref:Branched-chain amino acid transport system permease protein n=1 Tax=Actinoplanes digitatis TaxID=1868 RepID=A0A7W7HW55_9ACTN|nr:branched-chain amino acid ABC transporter permease [Actinoplanes digitatis]MBB4761808.1 branched-chain amino acid transport system permease protein [Actinoplanes digitatis]GID90919.1 branched-chain amino acid ABC transporter permease [Actinoplanes digitatis]